MASCNSQISEEISLSEFQEKLLLIPPADVNNCKEFRVIFDGFEAVARASSHFEAAFKAAVVFIYDGKLRDNKLVVKDRDGSYFYSMDSSSCNGLIYPRVRLSSMLIVPTLDSSAATDVSIAASNLAQTNDNEEGDLLESALRNVFGHTGFRPQQRETITATLSGKNVLSILSTGGGKSLTFMLPSALSQRPTIVISPIRSLIEDMFARATNFGLNSCRFLGGMNGEEINNQLQQFEGYKLVFTTPEMLLERLLDKITSCDKDNTIERIVFDEAHTISTWGSSFRPLYKETAEKMAALSAPKLLLSATVSHRIQSELKYMFGELHIISQSVYRENLSISIDKKTGKFYDQLQEVVEKHQNECGIIYCVLPNDVSKIHSELRKKDIPCAKYHGQLSDEAKNRNFQSWMDGTTALMVANASFGMGIDKPDVRYVIHAFLPTSIEEYFQQCGRAGRDGLPSTCQLLYSYTDKTALYKLFNRESQNVTHQHKAVNELIVLLENPVQCRHKLLMNYFGENREEFQCLINCDNCLNRTHYSSDGTGDALKVIQTLVEIGNAACSVNLLKLVLLGSRQKKVLTSNFDSLTNFGCLQKVFVPSSLLDTFLHILIYEDILGEKVESEKTFSVRVTLGQRAYLLLSLDTNCIKFVKS